ncbi:hypothetical protein SBI67_14815 [Mycolicibacterium sp. 120266]|uniref:hypothetical protein n=1 Tax=Mycolicibacterium sp. 120266 TaxID=3090601 RepID=UPI00299F29D0|nr:hypothetical protein [Mycolicibacterium sp. 120266]MDX1873391.1 hypothetical protein [Mycolicibacterium sp. 120266]
MAILDDAGIIPELGGACIGVTRSGWMDIDRQRRGEFYMSGDYREVTHPLTTQMLAPLPEDCLGILFDQPLADEEYRELAALLERHPGKELYALQLASATNPIADLRFLQYFPSLQHFSCNLHLLESFEGIQSLRKLKKLMVFRPDRKLSAAPLSDLITLRQLWLDGSYSDLAALNYLNAVTYIKMGYAGKLSDLSFLPPSVTKFSMNLGSTTNIDALGALPNLTWLAFHKVRSLANLTPLAKATSLQYLYLAGLTSVTELFDMSALTHLAELHVHDLAHLRELHPVLTAPNLRKLSVTDLPALQTNSWHETCTGWLAQGKPPFWE